MRFKRGLDASGVHPRLWQFLMWLDQQHLEFTEETLWITSLRRPFSSDDPRVRTKHATRFESFCDPRVDAAESLVTAADIRRWALDEVGRAEEFCRHVQVSYGPQIGVVLEPEWLSVARHKRMTGPHIHFQLKKPYRWTTLV